MKLLPLSISLVAFSAALVGAASIAPKTIAHHKYVAPGCKPETVCGGCDSNGCSGLDPGDYTVFMGETTLPRCVDYDHDGIGHCLDLPTNTYSIYNAGQQYIGDCFMIACKKGTYHGTEPACYGFYPDPGGPDN